MFEFKPDWDQARERMMAWWEREIVDRVVVQVTAPLPGERTVPEPADLMQQWTDIDHVLDAAEERMRLTYFGGEALPRYYCNLGPDVFVGYLGCDIIFGERTSWSVPLIEEWSQLDAVAFDPANKWWQLTQRMTELGGERFRGKALLGYTDIHGGGDAVAALRDPMNLAFDLVDHPHAVKRAMELVWPAWLRVYEEQMALIRRYQVGATTWMGLWHPGTWFPVSCDFICMVSPAMFREFFLGELRDEIEYLDRSCFHLDGPNALKHLDDLLDIEKLDAIQWVPGANSGPIAQWFPILKRMQAAGKGLQIHIEASELEGVMAELSPQGLCIVTGASSREEADAIIAKAARLTRAH